jgi:hypothetical protein
MAPQPQHSSPVSVFGPLVAHGMSVWTADADAWPLSDAPEDVLLLASPPRPRRFWLALVRRQCLSEGA